MVGRLELRDDFKEEAEWRREKAKQYPHDERYLAAATIFDRLAATVDAIPQDVFITFSEQPRNSRWSSGRGTVDRDAASGRLWLVAGNRLRISSDPLLRIEYRDADKRLHAAYPRAVRLRPLALATNRSTRDLMRPFPAEPMRMWPISTVNKPENDDPSIIEPVISVSHSMHF